MLHDLDDLALYGYCSLRYRYKVEWGLPYKERSPEEAYAQVFRKAVSRLLYDVPKKGVERAKEISQRVFDISWEAAWPETRCGQVKASGMKLDGHLALYEFMARIRSDDKIIGGRFETELSIKDFVVRHQIDGLVMRHDKSATRTLALIHVSREKSPLWAPKYQPMQFQWAMGTVRRQLQHVKRVTHWVFSPYTRVAPRMYDGAVERADFRAVAESLHKGVQSGVYMQTPHSERCGTCWYQRICSAQHCGTVDKGTIEQLRSKL